MTAYNAWWDQWMIRIRALVPDEYAASYLTWEVVRLGEVTPWPLPPLLERLTLELTKGGSGADVVNRTWRAFGREWPRAGEWALYSQAR